MRKVIAACLLVVMVMTFTGCDFKENEADHINKCGFVIVEELGSFGDYYMYLVYDEDTKVEYIYTGGYCTHSLCPYYDENGNIVIYEGD